MFVRSVVAVALAAAFSFGAVGAAQAATDIGTGNTSRNWAGYALPAGTGQSFDKVGASWVQPAGTGTCSPATMGIVAFAVAFDGFGNNTSEQAGTALQCSPNRSKAGTPFEFQHVAFWEVDPGPPHFIAPPLFKVSAGDHIAVTITYAAGTYTFKFENHTTGQSYTATGTSPGSTRTSVEAIVESPVPGGGAPLANFGKVTFRDPRVHVASSGDQEGNHDGDNADNADNNGNNGEDGDHQGKFVAITMTNAAGTVRAAPGDNDEDGFSVTWKHA